MNRTLGCKNNIGKIILLIVMAATMLIGFKLASAQVTVFNSTTGLTTIRLSFPQEFLTRTFFVRVPNGTVAEARMRIQGFNMQGLKGQPRDVIIVTDLSGSMSQTVDGVVKLVSARDADKSFISNVDTNYIQVGLVNYSTVAQLNQPLMTNKVTLNTSINRYRAGSYTNLGAALQLAINELNSARAQRLGTKKYILLMTDGWPNCLSSGSCADDPATNRAAEAWVLSLARTANQSNITIFAISFGNCGILYSSGGGGSTAHCVFMENVSNQTRGGMHFHAPNGDDLVDIYNSIAEMIEVNNLTTPTIRSASPLSMFGWSYPDFYNGDVLWNGASCGSGASCTDFRNLIQSNLNACSSSPCDIGFSVYSPTIGMLNLSDLFIEINQPPVGNYPPVGSCLLIPMLCEQDVVYAGIDDPRLVTDANDDLNTLTWRYRYSVEPLGGSYFFWSNQNNFNNDRQLALTIEPAYLQEVFWRTFFFNVSDPWGASTMSCINISYPGGCGASICGNGPPPGAGEQCELNNTLNNIYCQQTTLNCTNTPHAMTRDSYGNCNSTCGCAEDAWASPVCIAGSCGAVCSNDQSQPCTAQGGFLGMQTCNITTCQWNTCTPTGSCGDNIINQASEQCEPTNADNSNYCPQENESCLGAQLQARPDLLGNCNSECQCYNDTWSVAMCVADKCGAICSNDQTRYCTIAGGWPGIETCNTTTCQWNTCTSIGVCGDGTINQETEQCERNNTLNNFFCEQTIENCTEAPKARTRDLYGNCDAICGCIEDSWSADATCIAGSCGAICTAGASQACTTVDGYPGTQDCNDTTCYWNSCITSLSCGDNIITNPPESCELPGTLNDTDCAQLIEQCIGPKVAARDSYGNCGGLCTCIEDAFGEATNCSVEKCGASCDASTPPEDCTTTSGHAGTRTCDLASCTMGGCTRNPFRCESSIPNYLLHTGQEISIDLNDIFDGDLDSIESITYSHSPVISIDDDPAGASISVSSSDAMFETVNIIVRVEGVDSHSCPIRFINLDSRCDNPACEAFADAEDFEGLRANNCLDQEIWVTDPHAAVRVSNYVSSFLLPGFASRNFEYATDFRVLDGFGVSPSLGDQQTIFYITNRTYIPHGTENGSVIKITFDDYENPFQNYARICPKLVRYHYNIGDLGYDPNSTLLITGSRSVTGYYEKDGFVFSKGPYIFIAKVWMRE